MATRNGKVAHGTPREGRDAAALIAKAKAPPAWRRFVKKWAFMLDEGALVHDGDLKVDKLVVGPQPLVVTGDLRVKQLLRDGHRADETILIVLGDLDAGDVITYGAVLVAGDARVRGVLYGFSAHDRIFHVGGALRARAIVDGDHWFQVLGNVDVGVFVGSGWIATRGKPKRRARPHEALVRSAYEVLERDDDGSITTSAPKRTAIPRLIVAKKKLLA